MKKIIFLCSLFILALGALVPFLAAQASDAPVSPVVGISSASSAQGAPAPGVSSSSVLPNDALPSSAKVWSADAAAPSSSPASVVTEPTAKRKAVPAAAAAVAAPVAPKTRELSKLEKEKEKAQEDALRSSVAQKVEEMRNERLRQMPYMDRVYIRTSITPLKAEQKEEFLQGGPKDLQELIARAKSVHTQAKASYANISLYNRRMIVAFRKLFPEASLDVNDRASTLNALPYTGDDWHVTLRQPIFQGGALWNAFLQEKANLEAAKKQHDKTFAELVFDLSRAYFEYQRTLQTAEEHRALVDKMKRFFDMSEEKFKENIISEIEHLNVQSLYSQMQFDLESANQELEIAKLEMQKYLDLSVNDNVSIAKIYNLGDVVQGQAAVAGSPTPGAKATMPDVFKGEEKAPALPQMIDLSYGHRPELQVEAAKLQAARLGERVRWGEFLPKAYLTYKFGELGEAYTADGARQLDAGPDYQTRPNQKKEWQLMLEMNWNIGGNKVGYTFDRDIKAPNISTYDGGEGTKSRKNAWTIGVLDGLEAFVNVKQAEVDKLNQVVELEKAEKQVLQDVKESYYGYQKAVIQVNSTVKRLEYRKRLRDFSEYRLSKKEIELSEYLQAESDLVREKADLHRALKDYFSAKASLNHAVGIQNFMIVGTPEGK